MFVWHHHSLPITQYFSYYLWAPYLLSVQLFHFFFFFNTQTHWTQWRKKKNRTANPKKKRKKEPNSQSRKRKKKVKRRSKVAAVSPLFVFNYNITIELWVMETENSQNVFSVSITHNSKIRELSNGNRVIVCQITFLLWVPPFLSYEL